jgi:hypothetical protein
MKRNIKERRVTECEPKSCYSGYKRWRAHVNRNKISCSVTCRKCFDWLADYHLVRLESVEPVISAAEVRRAVKWEGCG